MYVRVLVQEKQKPGLHMTAQPLRHTMLNSPVSAWTEPPEYVLAAVVEQIQGDREVSANFRCVCRAWREAHDQMLTVLETKDAPHDADLWKKFGGVKTVDLNNEFPVNDIELRGLALLTGLTSLDLSSSIGVTNEGVRALAPLTRLTCLSLEGCVGVTDERMRALAPLTGLTVRT